MKSNDIEYKQKKADEFYDKKKYDKCIPIYEELLTILKGQKKVDEIYYKYAMSHYKSEAWSLAAFYFRNFYNTYYSNPHAEECAFLEAICYANESSRYSLEQTNTLKALDVFQGFVDKFPKSERIPEANKKMDELRGKMMKKTYESAYLYYKIKRYNAAVTSFRNLLVEYPDIENKEKIDFLIIKSLALYAKDSYKSKEEERILVEQKEFSLFKQNYPNSKYLPELEKINTTLNKELLKLKK